MRNLSPIIGRLRQSAESKLFRSAFAVLYLVNLVAFVLLLSCDCFHWGHFDTNDAHFVTALALTVSSYLVWMFFTFIGVGYLIFFQSARTAGRLSKRDRYRLNLVRAIGYPVLYAVFAAWGIASMVGQSVWLGSLSLTAFVAFYCAYFVARWEDGKPRPPSAPQDTSSRTQQHRTV